MKAVHEWFDKEPERTEREKQERAVLTWEEWDAIQVRHFAKKKNQKGAVKTLEECRKAQRLFVRFPGADSVSAVDADMVENFMHECGGTQSKLGENYKAIGIVKTLSHMSASFNRCRRTAGKKCVRGVVAQDKLLTVNPFEEVQWVEADDPDPRQFSRDELRAFLNWKYLAACPLAALFAKASFWARGRIEEMSRLRWDWVDREGFVTIPDGEAKWAKGRVIRLPPALLAEMGRFRTNAPYVWAGYVDQLRAYHRSNGHHSSAHKVKDFNPVRLLRLFQKWIAEWSEDAGAKGISHHAFRRTGLQLSREGKLRSFEAEFAAESNVTQQVAKRNYTTDPHRLKAEITYRNIANELRGDREFAALMGLSEPADVPMVTLDGVQAALARNDLAEAARLLAHLRG